MLMRVRQGYRPLFLLGDLEREGVVVVVANGDPVHGVAQQFAGL